MSEKRLAIVTGGARGIGRDIVFALAEQGRRVAALDIDEDNLAELLKLSVQKGFEDIITEKIDITDSPKFSAAIERLADDNDGVGILVNNICRFYPNTIYFIYSWLWGNAL